jgi:hypothetical protein
MRVIFNRINLLQIERIYSNLVYRYNSNNKLIQLPYYISCCADVYINTQSATT